MARREIERQVSLRFVGWGGEREGAGLPKKPGAKLRHAARSPVASRFPAHATLRARPGVPNLRRAEVFDVIRSALVAGRERNDFRVVHFSVQTNHLHLLVEAASAAAMSRGMQGLAIRIARGVNRVAGREGKVWADRYHARDGWRTRDPLPSPSGPAPTAEPRTWLLSTGWRRCGLIRLDEVPAAAFG